MLPFIKLNPTADTYHRSRIFDVLWFRIHSAQQTTKNLQQALWLKVLLRPLAHPQLKSVDLHLPLTQHTLTTLYATFPPPPLTWIFLPVHPKPAVGNRQVSKTEWRTQTDWQYRQGRPLVSQTSAKSSDKTVTGYILRGWTLVVTFLYPPVYPSTSQRAMCTVSRESHAQRPSSLCFWTVFHAGLNLRLS